MIETLVLAAALAVDAAAAAAGLCAAGASARWLVAACASFALAQGGMSALGAWGGGWLTEHASAWDHWIAFVLLSVVGARMIRGGEPDEGAPTAGLVALSVATSIDALAAGVSLPMLSVGVPVAVVVIAGVTLALSAVGAAAGKALGDALGARVEAVGGVVLIALGVKIVVTHLIA
jgi:putative Mn2+ efflux pump MntP